MTGGETIGGSKGHPGGKMIPAEAVPAVRTKTSSKVPINTILFIFFTSSVILIQRIKTPYFSLSQNIFIFRRINKAFYS